MKNFTKFNDGGGKFLTLTSNKFFSKMLLLVAAFFLLSSASAWAQDITLDFSSNTWGLPEGSTNKATSEASFTDTETGYTITLAASTGYYFNTDGYLMLGKQGATLTLPAFSSDVEKIEVVGRAGASTKTGQNIYVGTEAVSTATTGATGTNTYEIAEDYQKAGNIYVLQVTTSQNTQIVKINIYYKSEKSSAGLSFSETSISIEKGVDEFTAPTFSKSTTADVTFSSDNEEVATVSSDGTISLAGGLGTAVITASSEENDNYNAGTAICTIEVFTYNVYKKATSISSGKSYLIGAVLTDGTAFYAYPITSNYDYLNGNTSESSEEIKIKNSYDDTFLFTNDETNGWTIKQNTNSKYLYQTSTFNNFNVATSPTEGQYWTVSSNEDGTVTITNKSTSKYIQYSPSYTSFGCYTDAQTGAVLPTLYELVKQGSFTIGTECDGYATYYDAKAYIMPEGVKGGIITKADISETSGESGTLTISYDYTAGTTVPAGTALLLKGTAGTTYTFDYTTSDATAPTSNMLHGANAVDGDGKTYVDGTNVKYYLLSHYNGELGFFWYAAEGAAILYQSPYAFLAVDFGDSASGVKMFTLNEESTGIRSLAGDEDGTRSAAIYTLAGQRVSGMTKGGLYIVNGKKVLVK